MGLKCSMFGHSFGDPEVERDREEDGDEVVVTVREVKVCSRCGAESVVSENKEVTTLREPPAEETPDADAETETAADEADAPADGVDAGFDDETTAEPVPETDPETDDAELLGEDDPVFADEEDDTGADGETDEAVAAPPADEAEPGTPAADAGAEIVDAESGDAPGADPDAVADEPDEDAAGEDGDPPVADPEDLLPDDATPDDEPEPAAERIESPEGGDAPADADEAETDDGVILDEEPEPDPERGHGEWPDSDDVGPPAGETEVEEWPEDAAGAGGEGGAVTEAPPDAAAEESSAEAVDTGIASAGRAPSPDAATDEDRGAELFCPSCNYSAALERASLRVGDICPECKRGYLSER